jgi:serine/threonine-protein kinase
MISPDRWHQIEAAFQTALNSDPNLRSEFLDEACAGDPELREEVRTLLAAHEQAGDFMDLPALAIAAELDEPDPLSLSHIQSLGPYRIVRHIATGGMGDVYQAQDSKLDRKIALKVLGADFARDHERVRRFRQEARAASALNHPNIITIYDIGEESGIHYMAMEFVEGATIRQRLADGNLALADALNVAIQAAGALETAHQAGIVHRDIKPENIMVRPDGYVKVLDFGLAKLAESQAPRTVSPVASRDAVDTEPGMVMGTARYMSPEQARGLQLDGRTDVFSLGVVLYEMITGQPPFKGDTAIDAVAAMLNTDAQPLAACEPSAPSELEPIVRKAMRKDREARYSSMGRLLADLVEVREQTVRSGATSISVAPGPSGEARTHEDTSSASGMPARTTARHRADTGIATSPVAKPAAYRLWILAGAALLLSLAGLAYFTERNKPPSGSNAGLAGATTANSIVVLPFVDQTEDKDDDYLPEGIGDSLVDSLSRLSRLNVMSRQSALRYKGRQIGPDVAGRELGVKTVVSGQVDVKGDAISIAVDIADATSNHRIWSKTYTGAMGDLLRLQEQISRDVSIVLLPDLSDADQGALKKRFTQNSDAYILYLRGLHSMRLRTAPALKESIDLFKQAAGRDPQYALAYAGLADAYVFMGDYGINSPREALEQAQTAVAKALSLDENLAEAHTTLGHLKLYYYWDWKDAEAQFKRAIDLEPNYAAAHQGLANYYAALGRFGEAIAEINTALRYDPRSPSLNQAKGFHLYLAGHYDDAIQQLESTVRTSPTFVPAHAVLGMAYLQKDNKGVALDEFQKSVALSNRSPAYLAQLGRAYALVGNVTKAQESIAELKSLRREGFIPSYWLALIYAALGENRQALEFIGSAVEEHDSEVIFINVGPTFDEKLRADAQFKKVVGLIGLDR